MRACDRGDRGASTAKAPEAKPTAAAPAAKAPEAKTTAAAHEKVGSMLYYLGRGFLFV